MSVARIVPLLLVAFASAAAFAVESRTETEFRDLMKLDAKDLPMGRDAALRVTLSPAASEPSAARPPALSLDGEWELERYDGKFKVAAEVPGGVPLALFRAGKIGDPYYGDNAQAAREQVTDHDWIYRREFDLESVPAGRAVLSFGGVCDRMSVFLNGERVGTHQGMFGGPDIDVTGRLRVGRNELKVLLLRALPWKSTVVFNCSYGWHYSQVVPLGIWRGVTLRFARDTELAPPFVRVNDAHKGEVSYLAGVRGTLPSGAKLSVRVAPANFEGRAYGTTVDVKGRSVRLDFAVPEPRLWWPNGHGEQNLYTLETRLLASDGRLLDAATSRFGMRDLAFTPSLVNPRYYRRNAVINGRPVFLKGTNWCTIDALMRFDRSRYEPVLRRAREQGTNWLRAWGAGLMETDEFYDLCDELGITVMQEWPSCWESHLQQPVDALEETVVRTAERLRNHPSLIIWCGGNEGGAKDDDAIMWGVVARETMLHDGTRPFYVQDNDGEADSQVHHHHIRWSREYPTALCETHHGKDHCMHEFGNDSPMAVSSYAKVVPPEEMKLWPLPADGAFAYHTATFNGGNEIHRRSAWSPTHCEVYRPETIVDRYDGRRVEPGDLAGYRVYARTVLDDARLDSAAALVFGSQFSQAMTVAPMLAESRVAYPRVPSVAYYKLNDVAPAGTWSVVDWFGVPKIAHWFVQDFFAPTVALAALPTLEFAAKEPREWTVPARVVSDIPAPGVVGRLTVYGPDLKPVTVRDFGEGGELKFAHGELAGIPSFVVTEAVKGGNALSSTWLPVNYPLRRGCLLDLPRTSLAVKRGEGWIEIANVGGVPAVGVELDAGEAAAAFHPSDNWFFLAAGGKVRVDVAFDGGHDAPVKVRALNADAE